MWPGCNLHGVDAAAHPDVCQLAYAGTIRRVPAAVMALAAASCVLSGVQVLVRLVSCCYLTVIDLHCEMIKPE